MDRVGETELYRQMVHEHPKLETENAVEYMARIAELVAERLRGGRAEGER